MPFEIVTVRVREHPHAERTPCGVVSWTEQIGRDGEINRQYSKESEQILRTAVQIVERMMIPFSIGKMLLFDGGILQFAK